MISNNYTAEQVRQRWQGLEKDPDWTNIEKNLDVLTSITGISKLCYREDGQELALDTGDPVFRTLYNNINYYVPNICESHYGSKWNREIVSLRIVIGNLDTKIQEYVKRHVMIFSTTCEEIENLEKKEKNPQKSVRLPFINTDDPLEVRKNFNVKIIKNLSILDKKITAACDGLDRLHSNYTLDPFHAKRLQTAIVKEVCDQLSTTQTALRGCTKELERVSAEVGKKTKINNIIL